MKDFKEYTRNISDLDIFKRLVTYIKPEKKKFFSSVILMVFSTVMRLIPAFLLGLTIDAISNNQLTLEEKLTLIVYYSVGFFLSFILDIVAEYFHNLWLQEIGQNIIKSIRLQTFDHINNLGPDQINQVPVGKLVTRVMNDTNTLSEMYTGIAANLIKNIFFLLGTLGILFIINYKLTLILLLFLPVVIIAAIIFRKYSRQNYREVRSGVSNINAYLSENLSGIKIIQSFNQEEKINTDFLNKSSKLKNSYLKEIFIFGIYRPLIYLLSIVGVVFILYYGALDVINNAIYLIPFTSGLLFSFYYYVREFFQPILQIAEEFNLLQNAFASAEKVFDVLDTKPTIQDKIDSIPLDSFNGEIEFKNVWFNYIPNEWVLKNVSFKLNKDETIALVGPTGSGKSTILKLIVRDYEVQKGNIYIDGIDIRDINRKSLRKFIGQMMQDVFLFSGTIKQNISLFDNNKSLENIIEASRFVGLDSIVSGFKEKYDKFVLERGNNFSSGEKQLISFARTVLYNPSLMMLDEATSNIDSESEEIIQKSLEKMMNISTMIIVAHRLSTIQHADKILVLNNGKIIERGNHQELLKIRGSYYNLYKIQYDKEKKNVR
jgi:ATP-binding cassette subfamily B multidrug efflux pump